MRVSMKILLALLLLGLTIGCGSGTITDQTNTSAPGNDAANQPLDTSGANDSTATDTSSPDTTGSEDTTGSTDTNEPGDTGGSEDTSSNDMAAEFDLGKPVTPKTGRNDHTLLLEGHKREFIVYLSAKAKTAQNAPVVFMFHGSGGNGQKFYNISHWRETADREGLIVVFPTALVFCYHQDNNNNGVFTDQGERRVGTKWNQGKLGDPEKMPLCDASVLAKLSPENRKAADHPLADDVAFTKAMIAFLEANYSVDAKRVYATGFSNGGGFVARLTLEASEYLAATHSHAGFLSLAPSPTARPISYIASVGQKDDRFTDPLGVDAFPLEESLLTEVPDLKYIGVTKFIGMLQLEDSYQYQEMTPGGKKVISFTYDKSKIDATNQFMFVVIGGLYHQYANGTNHPLILADVVWEFFKQYSLP